MNQDLRDLLRDDYIVYVEPCEEGIRIHRWDNVHHILVEEVLPKAYNEIRQCLDYFNAHTARRDELREKKIPHPAYNALVRAQRIEMRKRRKP